MVHDIKDLLLVLCFVDLGLLFFVELDENFNLLKLLHLHIRRCHLIDDWVLVLFIRLVGDWRIAAHWPLSVICRARYDFHQARKALKIATFTSWLQVRHTWNCWNFLNWSRLRLGLLW